MKVIIRPILLSFLLVGLLGLYVWQQMQIASDEEASSGPAPAKVSMETTSFIPIIDFVFNDPSVLEGWFARDFQGRTIFEVQPTPEGGKALRCTSANTSSALFKEIDAPKSKRLFLTWDWRMVKFPQWNNNRRQFADKTGHDFGARLYVIFKGKLPMQHDIIQYVWDNEFKEGDYTDGPNLGTIKVKVIVTRHGEPPASGWVTERRDLFADYEKVFGKPLQKELKVVGMMVDSDDSSSSSEVFIRRIAVEVPQEGTREETLASAEKVKSKKKDFLPIEGMLKAFSRPIKIGAKVSKKVIDKTIDTTKEGLQTIVELKRKDEEEPKVEAVSQK